MAKPKIWFVVGAALVNIAASVGLALASQFLDVKEIAILSQSLLLLFLLLILEIELVPFIELVRDRRLVATEPEDILKKSKSIKIQPRFVLAVWAFESWHYPLDLKPYFETEKSLLEAGTVIQRIVSPSIPKDYLIDHCQEFKKYIVKGIYQLSIIKVPRELLITDRKQVIIYAEALTGSGSAVAIGPLIDPALVASHIREFEDAFKAGRLLAKPQATTFEAELNSWLS
ncbi:MAG: hypothetical protein ABR562_02330 [Thermoplasmatota archaeon]